jgi:hypothetical protein
MSETLQNLLPESLLWQILLGVGIIATIHAVITLGLKWWVYEQVKEMHEVGQASIAEFWAGFDSLKSWVMSARAASKDAEYAVKHTLTTETSKSEVLKRMETIPDETAEKVSEKLKADSGEIKSLPIDFLKPPSGKATDL